MCVPSQKSRFVSTPCLFVSRTANTHLIFCQVLQEIDSLLAIVGSETLSAAKSISSLVSDALAQIQSGTVDPTSLTDIASEVAEAASNAAISVLAQLAKQLSDLAPFNNTGEVSTVRTNFIQIALT